MNAPLETSPSPPSWTARISLGLLVLVWVAGVVAATGYLWQYKMREGAGARAPSDWPVGTTLSRETGKGTLLLFAHPRCPCTRATLSELARLMTPLPKDLSTTVVFLHPEGVEDSWSQTELWRRAQELPGVRVMRDDGGVETARFGARTSGQILFFDGAGVLRYRGGLTPSRGHEGDSAGKDALAALLKGESSKVTDAKVFGCALTDAAARGETDVAQR